MIFTDYWKVLVLKFSVIGNTVFFLVKKFMERWYLLVTEKFLFWPFRWWEIRSFFQAKIWRKDYIYAVFLSFLWYSGTWEIWFFAQWNPDTCIYCIQHSCIQCLSTIAACWDFWPFYKDKCTGKITEIPQNSRGFPSMYEEAWKLVTKCLRNPCKRQFPTCFPPFPRTFLRVSHTVLPVSSGIFHVSHSVSPCFLFQVLRCVFDSTIFHIFFSIAK